MSLYSNFELYCVMCEAVILTATHVAADDSIAAEAELTACSGLIPCPSCGGDDHDVMRNDYFEEDHEPLTLQFEMPLQEDDLPF